MKNPLVIARTLFPAIEWAGSSPIFDSRFDTDDEPSIVVSKGGVYVCLVESGVGKLYGLVSSEITAEAANAKLGLP